VSGLRIHSLERLRRAKRQGHLPPYLVPLVESLDRMEQDNFEGDPSEVIAHLDALLEEEEA